MCTGSTLLYLHTYCSRVRSPGSGLGTRDSGLGKLDCARDLRMRRSGYVLLAHTVLHASPSCHYRSATSFHSSLCCWAPSCAPVGRGFRTCTVRTRTRSRGSSLTGVSMCSSRVSCPPSVRELHGTGNCCACVPLRWVDARRCSCRLCRERVRDRHCSAERFASDITHDPVSEVSTER